MLWKSSKGKQAHILSDHFCQIDNHQIQLIIPTVSRLNVATNRQTIHLALKLTINKFKLGYNISRSDLFACQKKNKLIC